MNGFFQILGGGVVGAVAVIAAQLAPVMMAPQDQSPAAVAEVWPAGIMVLAQTANGCPVGWATGGAVSLGSVAPIGGASNGASNGAIAPATVQTPAFLCIKVAS